MLAMDPRWLGLDLRLLSAVELGPWHGSGLGYRNCRLSALYSKPSRPSESPKGDDYPLEYYDDG
jgi:hypothetical protein